MASVIGEDRVNFSFVESSKDSLFPCKPIKKQGPLYPLSQITKKIAALVQSEDWESPLARYEVQKSRTCIHGVDLKLEYQWGTLKEIFIKGKALWFSSDESGPSLHIYVGKNWQKDRDYFFNNKPISFDIVGHPSQDSYKAQVNKTILELNGIKYLGSWKSDCILRSFPTVSDSIYSAPPYLVLQTTDLQGDKPSYYKTADIVTEFQASLNQTYETLQKETKN